MIELEPIGVVRSPFHEPQDVPRFMKDRASASGMIEVFASFREGLRDLEGFSHLVLIWRFHKSVGASLTATPPYDVGTKGVFATRSPRRPNSIGLSVVELDRIEDGIVHIRNFDMADGTPILDIKPYIPDGINPEAVKLGWLDAVRRVAKPPSSEPAAVELVREYWRRMQTNDFRYAAELLSEDFVLEWPLSNERIRGRDKFVAVNEEYPAMGRWEFTVHRVIGNENDAVSDVSVTDGTIKARAITFSTIRDGKVARQAEYWPEPYVAPDNRRHLTESID